APRREIQDEILAPKGLEPAQYDDYGTMLDECELDGVSLIVPHALHFSMCRQALEAGVNVLVEKPMVTESGHADQLADIVRETGRHLHVSFQGPHSSAQQTARRLIRDGAIGDIIAVRAFLDQAWLNLIRHHPQKKWRLDKKIAGGGQLYDSGSHLINGLLWTTELTPARVYAEIELRDQTVDINSGVTIRFDTGAVGTVTVLGESGRAGMRSELVITGAEGEIVLPQGAHGGADPVLYGLDGELEYDPVPAVTPQQHFVDVLHGKAETLCGPLWGRRLAHFMDALYASAENGAPETITDWPA
ncbi:MAG: Gfo/Idh/MocA family oxidoreductase, partial [Phycisphaeraceae bacterium]|nr:Gfo/Idh/MocA family oxidoreductase [Phycisphaeraceae bacterium]